VLDARRIHFRPLAVDDLPTIHRWLNTTPAVKEFWAHGKEISYQEVALKYGARARGETPTRSYMILYGDTPIGYVQAYRWRDYPDYAQYLDLREEACGLDLFIGEEAYLYRGLGSCILRSFLRDIVFSDPCIESCVITPEVRNPRAVRAYEKAGFKLLRIMEHPDDPGPVCVLRIGRNELPA
jgi:RimJ/RimL family protein N-acetyltransferase